MEERFSREPGVPLSAFFVTFLCEQKSKPRRQAKGRIYSPMFPQKEEASRGGIIEECARTDDVAMLMHCEALPYGKRPSSVSRCAAATFPIP